MVSTVRIGEAEAFWTRKAVVLLASLRSKALLDSGAPFRDTVPPRVFTWKKAVPAAFCISIADVVLYMDLCKNDPLASRVVVGVVVPIPTLVSPPEVGYCVAPGVLAPVSMYVVAVEPVLTIRVSVPELVLR